MTKKTGLLRTERKNRATYDAKGHPFAMAYLACHAEVGAVCYNRSSVLYIHETRSQW